MQNPQGRARVEGTQKGASNSSFAAETVIATTFDPAEFEMALQPWELLCQPLRAGHFEHRITAIKSEKFFVYRERYDLPLVIRGLSPDDMLVIGVPIEYDRLPTYWRTQRSKSEMVATLPGPLDANIGSGHRQLVAMVALGHLRQTMPEESFAKLEEAASSHLLALPPASVSAFVQWGGALLDAIESRPNAFDSPNVVEVVLRELENLLVAISSALRPQAQIGNLTARRLGVSRALEFLRHRPDSRVSLGELCSIARVSERTLQYAFREELGMSPTEFMRRRRLHSARQHLLTSCPGEISVSKVATDHGFYELGRFALEYRRVFGERPSESLRR